MCSSKTRQSTTHPLFLKKHVSLTTQYVKHIYKESSEVSIYLQRHFISFHKSSKMYLIIMYLIFVFPKMYPIIMHQTWYFVRGYGARKYFFVSWEVYDPCPGLCEKSWSRKDMLWSYPSPEVDMVVWARILIFTPCDIIRSRFPRSYMIMENARLLIVAWIW